MEKKRIFIGVAWPYVNGDLHVGHLAGYLLPADMCARFHRLRGHEVLMVSGSDCYGTPTTIEADKRGVTPQEIVNEYHPKHKALMTDTLQLSFDLFTRTTTENHTKVVQDIFCSAIHKGYIEKRTTQQYFDPEEERFLPDRYVEGTCPECGFAEARGDQCDQCGALFEHGDLQNPHSKTTGNQVESKDTEHYFFLWNKLEPFLKGYVKEHGGDWRDWIRKDTLHWLEDLQPRAITRDISWGVPIPQDGIPEDLLLDRAESKRIYVWFEAVIGYLSASMEWAKDNSASWEEFWRGDDITQYYFMGKDNLVFHTLFWPGELHVHDNTLHLPDVQVINQFLNLEGKQFSKSRGVVVDSRYITETYGLDPVRFYLTSIMPERADTNFSWEEFVERHNNVLISTIGNFINRTLTLAQGYDMSDAVIQPNIMTQIEKRAEQARTMLETQEYRRYVETITELADFGNKYLSEHEPWSMTDAAQKQQVLVNALGVVLAFYIVSAPLLISTHAKLGKLLGLKINEWPDDVSITIQEQIRKLSLKKATPLFERIDTDIVEKERKKAGLV